MKFKISILFFMSCYSIALFSANIDTLITNAQGKLNALNQSIDKLAAEEKKRPNDELVKTVLATTRGSAGMQQNVIGILTELKACMNNQLQNERFKISDMIRNVKQYIASDEHYIGILLNAKKGTNDPAALGMIEAQLLVLQDKAAIESQLVNYLEQLEKCFAQVKPAAPVLTQKEVAKQYPILARFIVLDDYDWTSETPKLVETLVRTFASFSLDFGTLSRKNFREFPDALKDAFNFLHAQKTTLGDKKHGELKALLDDAQAKYADARKKYEMAS